MYLKNKKYAWKRGAAAVLAAIMMVQTPLGSVTTFATETAVSENSAVSDNTATVESIAVSENPVLNYAYIEHAQLDAGKVQNILVSAEAESLAWQNAQLTLVSEENGEQVQIPCAGSEEDVLRFSFNTTGMQSGVYRVEKMTYSYIEENAVYTGEYIFTQIDGMQEMCFGLGVDNPLAESEFTSYDEAGKAMIDEAEVSDELLDVNVVSLTGAQENLEAASPVALAVQQAAAEMTGSEKADRNKGAAVTDAGVVDNDRKIAGSLVVFLDPGHDETHAGARANGLEEENLTLKVAEYCKEYLEDTYSDVVVYMSRPTGDCPYPGTKSADCNANRVVDAYNKGADVYVSLHFNATAGGSTTATGAIVFYPNSNYDNQVGTEGATLASKIIEQLEKLGLKNNGIQIRNSGDNTTYPDGSLADYYGVIRRCKEVGIPAVIVEHAFLNNAQDAAFLQSEDNLEKLGIADALGIAQAYGLSTEEVEFDAEELNVTEIDGANGTFKIVLGGATPVKRIANIKFKVYPTENKKKEYTYTAQLTDKKTGTYSVVGNVGEHGKLEGKYKVIAYAFDAAGKKTQLRSATFTIVKGKADTTGMKVTGKLSSSEKTATVKLIGASDVKGVYFKVYSKKAGGKKAKKYRAEKLSNGQWKATVKISDHKKAGDYVIKSYIDSYFGDSYEAVKGGFTVEGPRVKKLQMTKLNLTKGTFRVALKGVESKSGVKKVQVIVETLDGKKISKTYTAKKQKSGNYYADINMKSFQYQCGTYRIQAKVKDGNGINEIVSTIEKEIEEPTPVLSAKLKSKHTKLVLTASDLGIGANVKGVRFKVIPLEKRSAAKMYTVATAKKDVYIKTINVKDFGVSGKYRIYTYVKTANGKYKKVGKTQHVTVPDVEGGTVKVKSKTDSASYVILSDIKYNGKIEKVQVKAWPLSNKKAKYTYKAAERSNGSYRALIKSGNHKGIGGEYKYQIIVTTANGIVKTVKSGKMTLGQSEAINGEQYPISGTSQVTVSQMVSYYKKNATYPTFYSVSDAPTLKKFCQMYYDECEKEGIRAEVAFAQAMHETNFLRYGGDVGIEQYNFAGIGATGNGAKGNSFETVRIGIRAQVQHLKAYANNEPLAQACVDPRFTYVTRGCAPYVEWLSIPNNPYGKGWATDPNYAVKLKRMISDLRNT